MTKHQKTEPKTPSLTAAINAAKPAPSALDAKSIDELLAEPDTEPAPPTPEPDTMVEKIVLFVGGPKNGMREQVGALDVVEIRNPDMQRTGSYEIDIEAGLATWNPITPDDFDRLPPVDKDAPVT